MPKIQVRLLGLDDIKRRLKELPKHYARAAARYNTSVANEAHTDAIRRISEQAVDTGRGRSAVRLAFYNDGLTVELIADFAYAAFVEFGTGPRGRETVPGNIPLPQGWRYHSGNGGMPPLTIIRRWCERHGIDPDAAFVIARALAKNGLPSRPFLYPAYLEVRQKYQRGLSRIIQAASRELR